MLHSLVRNRHQRPLSQYSKEDRLADDVALRHDLLRAAYALLETTW